MTIDPFHKKVVQDALAKGTEEVDVKLTIGELFLFHVLLQDYAIELVGKEKFIPLMQRNAERLQSVELS